MKRWFAVTSCVMIWASLLVSAADVSSLLSRFQSERDVAAKEAIIFEIAQQHLNAGPELLQIAKSTSDPDTRWLAIRGLGYLKFEPATQFLLTCLSSPQHYVRANAARALGEVKAYSAEPQLIALLRTEQDNGVIEQTSLALEMIKAKRAVPILKGRAETAKSQTECWLLDAIAVLGGREDVPFVAERLYDRDQIVGYCAAAALAQLTGADLRVRHEGPFALTEVISKSKEWWELNAANWK